MCTEPSPFRLFKKNILPSLLLVEDDDIDAENFMRSVKKHNIPNPVFIARGGRKRKGFWPLCYHSGHKYAAYEWI